MNNQNNNNHKHLSEEVSDAIEETSSIKFCPNCGTEIKADAKFCSLCGTNLIDPSNIILPPSKKENFKKFLHKKKKLLITIGVSIIAIALVLGISFCIMCSIAKDKAVGIWKSYPVYLSAYGGDYVSTCLINADGSWLQVISGAYDGTVISSSSGSWYMDGMDVVLEEHNKPGRMNFRYHLNDTITNGYYEYERVVINY